jgi:hypothetical protein
MLSPKLSKIGFLFLLSFRIDSFIQSIRLVSGLIIEVTRKLKMYQDLNSGPYPSPYSLVSPGIFNAMSLTLTLLTASGRRPIKRLHRQFTITTYTRRPSFQANSR